MRSPDGRRLRSWLRRFACALFVGGPLAACATPNSSASIALHIAGAGAEAAGTAADLAAVRRLLAADGFSRTEPGPGPIAGPEHEHIEFLFSQASDKLIHGFVSVAEDGDLHLLVVDNRHGERDGFDAGTCRTILSLRSRLRAQFGDRLLAPTPYEQSLQHSQLRACE